jgi:hypothetical protein
VREVGLWRDDGDRPSHDGLAFLNDEHQHTGHLGVPGSFGGRSRGAQYVSGDVAGGQVQSVAAVAASAI